MICNLAISKEIGAPAETEELDDAVIDAGVTVFHSWDSRFEEPEGFVIRIFQAMTRATKNLESSRDPSE